MRLEVLFSLIVLLFLVGSVSAAPKDKVESTPGQPENRPEVEVVFVLDTTGSMSGLIEGAKKKIWQIANQILLGEPMPIVRMGLVGFRDKGDAYVTTQLDLTDNIDKVHSELMKFQAQGGGDRPENVNQALYEAVHEASWSSERRVLKIIYLAGDSPPHNEYEDVPTYDVIARAAAEKEIYINTILCGGHADTGAIWKEIARLAEGRFFAIEQSGGVTDIPTPYDKEMAKLNAEMTRTVVVFGTREEQKRAAVLNDAAEAISEAPSSGMTGAAADRAVFCCLSRRAGSADLLEALEGKTITLEELNKKKELMPAELAGMTLKEQKDFIAGKKASRAAINKKIKVLAAKRAEYIKAELAKKGDGPGSGFDAKVYEAIKEQGAKKKIRYK